MKPFSLGFAAVLFALLTSGAFRAFPQAEPARSLEPSRTIRSSHSQGQRIVRSVAPAPRVAEQPPTQVPSRHELQS